MESVNKIFQQNYYDGVYEINASTIWHTIPYIKRAGGEWRSLTRNRLWFDLYTTIQTTPPPPIEVMQLHLLEAVKTVKNNGVYRIKDLMNQYREHSPLDYALLDLLVKAELDASFQVKKVTKIQRPPKFYIQERIIPSKLHIHYGEAEEEFLRGVISKDYLVVKHLDAQQDPAVEVKKLQSIIPIGAHVAIMSGKNLFTNFENNNDQLF